MLNRIPTQNYLKIYFWRILSLVTGFLSLLIVVPHLSSDPEIYGVYSVCIAFTLYLSYADIGFLSAGQKYAAEAFARGNRKDEVEVLGFTAAILLLMILPFAIAMIFCYTNPGLLISDLSVEGKEVASKIFLVSGTLFPIQVVFQRITQTILIIRIKEFISLRVDVVFNLLKIASIFYFFHGESYMIVEYYLFAIVMTIAGSLIVLMIIRRTEKYNLLALLKSIQLSKKWYYHTSKLAFSSLVLTIGWIIYYEIDLILIGKWLTPNDVAIYAIGFTILNFLRNLWNIVFSPFSQRFNHYVALDSGSKLRDMIKRIIDYTLPLSIIVTLVLFLSAEKLVYYWVGEYYEDSVLIVQVLILGTGFSFVTKPSSFYFTANTEYKFIYILGIMVPIIFCLGVAILLPSYNLVGLAIAKSIAMFSGLVISIVGISKIYNPLILIRKWSINLLLLSMLIIYLVNVILLNLFTDQFKSTANLVLLVLIMGMVIIVSYVLILLTKKEQRQDIMWIKNKVFSRLK